MYDDRCMVAVQGLLLWVTVQKHAWVDDFGCVRFSCALDVVLQIKFLIDILTPSIHFLNLLCNWSFSFGSPQL